MDNSGTEHRTDRNTPKNTRNSQPDYARYSGITFTSIAIILLGLYAGIKLDEHFQTSTSWITALMTIVSAVLSLVYLFRQLMKK